MSIAPGFSRSRSDALCIVQLKSDIDIRAPQS